MKDFFNLRKSKLLLLTLLAVIVGASPAWAQKALPYSYGFEDNSLETDGWTTQNPSGLNSSEFGINSSAKKTGSYGFRFSSYNDNGESTQYLISPELNAPAGIIMTFEYAASSTSTSGEKFKVGYSTTDADISSFTFGEEHSTSSMSWTTCEETFPAGTKYVAIYYYPKYQYRLYIDDITFENNNPYKTPKAFAATGVTATTATFGWTAGNDETAWQIAYSTTEGFDADAATTVNVTTNPYTLEGLTAETTYYARIRADYGGGNYSSWSDEVSFKPTNAIPTTVNDGSQTNNYVPFYGSYVDTNGTMSQFITPSTSLTAIQGRQITELTFYTKESSIDFGTARFNVFMKECTETTFESTTFDWTDMDQVASNTSVNITDGKMVITLDSPFDYTDGNLMIGFSLTATSSWKSTSWYGISSTGSAIYAYSSTKSTAAFLPKMTITSLPGAPVAVKKPKSLATTEVGATTATFGWTDGEEGLTAWQIAYSTNADFVPDTEGTKVDVDANPYTLTELTAATTYYAYIRAKKGNDYSAWSNKVEFTTLAAVPVISLSTTSHNFGMVSDADAQALTLTISNTGGASLTGLSVTASEGFTVTDAEGNALTATTIAASSTLTLKVKVSALGQQEGTITINGNEMEEQTVTVSGYRLDDSKILETFASLPDRWSASSGWTYNPTTGAKTGSQVRTFTTPKILVAEGEVLAINAKLNYSGGYVKIEGSADNGSSWTAFEAQTFNYSNGGLNTTDFVLFTVSGIPAGTYNLRLTGEDVYINVFNGFTYISDPVFALYSNEDCTSAQTSPATKNFGFDPEAKSQLYYIKNTGNGQIDLTIEQADGFTAEVADAALAEGESTALTVTMTATEGLHEGTITVTAKNHDNDAVLGTFVVNVNGAITGEKNNVVLTAFPAGWQNNNWAINNDAARIWSSTPSDLITTSLKVTEGEKLLVEAYKYYSSSDSQLSYSYSTDNGTTWSDAVSLTDQLTTSYKIIAISGIPAGNVLMKFTGTYAYIRQIYGFEAVEEPIMTFTASDYNFNMISKATPTENYTIKNEGTATLNNLLVTCDNSNFTITVADNATSIAANSEVTFTVTLNTTVKGAQSGTVTISGDGVTAKTFNVSGYVADDTKIFTTFAALPDRWTSSSWSFSEANGASATSSSSKLETPKIKIVEGEKLAISVKQQYSGSSYYVTINGSSDNGATWTAYTKNLSNDVLNNTTYTVVELDDIPTTVNKLQLVGYYVNVNGFNGFTYDDNDPQFAMYSNEECTSAIAANTATNNWGFVTKNETATYYIKNTGTGTMTLSKSDAPAGFTVTLGNTSLGAGESTSLIVAMANNSETNEGYHAGSVVLTATDNANNVLGTFTVTSSGVVVGSKTDINFANLTAFPAGWEATNWSVSSGKATISYTSGTITTGTYTVAKGESLVVEACKNSSSSYATIALTYSYSTDGGSTWSAAKDITPTSTSYELIAISDIPVGSAIIKFTGTNVDIDRIYGYTAVNKANIALDKTADYDFGMKTADDYYVITVTNDGTAAMTGLTATLATGTDYSAEVSKTDLAVNETATVTVTQKFDAAKGLASLADVLTISADGLAAKTINLSGKTRDASKWYVDFADGIPSNFVETGSWSASSNYASTNSSTETSLITQPITLAAGEKIQFDAKNPYSGSLKVRFSINGGISWSDYIDYSSQMNSSTFTTLILDLGNTAEVTAIVEFCGRYYVQLDNIYGGTLNATAPMVQVKESTTVVESGITKAFGPISSETTATYTIKNVGNGTLTITSPVTTTGAATATVSATSLANGQSATLTITMPVAAPYKYKEGVVTVETSLGDFVINYNATVLNPNALDEQFASGKPAGWYFGGYWEVSSQRAENTASGVADLITEQLAVAGTSDVLTFQAAKSGSSTPTFNVYTSQDRVNWTPVDLSGLTLTTSYQDVNISGLAAGDYYVKISGARVKVDNFLGWTKKNNTRDLYVTATSMPATAQLGVQYTATATVNNLIGTQNVCAKLFFGDDVVASETISMAQHENKTISIAYTPETLGEYDAKVVVCYVDDDAVAYESEKSTVVVDYPSLTLSETTAPTLTDGTYNVTLDRTFNAGWSTVCLPFALPVSEIQKGAVAYKFTDYKVEGTAKTLSFEKVTELEAGKPYVIWTESAISSLTLNAVVISAKTEAQTVTFNNVSFVGTFERIDVPGMDGKWGVTAAGKIGVGNSSAYINGFRAYFEGELQNARLAVFDDDVTGIRYLSADQLNNDAIYNLNGQRVETMKKGQMYIKNGKKMIRK